MLSSIRQYKVVKLLLQFIILQFLPPNSIYNLLLYEIKNCMSHCELKLMLLSDSIVLHYDSFFDLSDICEWEKLYIKAANVQKWFLYSFPFFLNEWEFQLCLFAQQKKFHLQYRDFTTHP